MTILNIQNITIYNYDMKNKLYKLSLEKNDRIISRRTIFNLLTLLIKPS